MAHTVTNRAPSGRGFNVRAGAPNKHGIVPVKTVIVPPGATQTLDLIDPDHPVIQGWVKDRSVEIVAEAAPEPEPAPEAAPVPSSKSKG